MELKTTPIEELIVSVITDISHIRTSPGPMESVYVRVHCTSVEAHYAIANGTILILAILLLLCFLYLSLAATKRLLSWCTVLFLSCNHNYILLAMN